MTLNVYPTNDQDLEQKQAVDAQHSLSWACKFGSCSKLRVYEGGRPGLAEDLGWCPVCKYLCCETEPNVQSTIAAMIDQHLI
jgi:hypothetical protein